MSQNELIKKQYEFLIKQYEAVVKQNKELQQEIIYLKESIKKCHQQ